MKTYDFQQRLEEIQIALARLFDSPKTANVSLLDQGDTVTLHMSWVVQSQRDSTLDSRCAATIHATHAQLERYASLHTAQRRAIQQRIRERVRASFEASRNPPPPDGSCAIDVTLDDTTFAVSSDDDYFPSIN
jgi:Tfp pilus assembly protein PilN